MEEDGAKKVLGSDEFMAEIFGVDEIDDDIHGTGGVKRNDITPSKEQTRAKALRQHQEGPAEDVKVASASDEDQKDVGMQGSGSIEDRMGEMIQLMKSMCNEMRAG